MPLISFYIHCKHQKTSAFLIFSGVSKEISGMKWVKTNKYLKIDKYFTTLLLYRCQNNILRSETTVNSSSKKKILHRKGSLGKVLSLVKFQAVAYPEASRRQYTGLDPQTICPKLCKITNYLIISSTQTLPHFLRHLL